MELRKEVTHTYLLLTFTSLIVAVGLLNSCCGIAQIYQERKEYAKAHELYKESLRVGRAALGSFHSEVAVRFGLYCLLYYK